MVSLVEMAKARLLAGNSRAFLPAKVPPPGAPSNCSNAAGVTHRDLGEGKLGGAQENQLLYWLGVAHDTLGERAAAKRCSKRGRHRHESPVARRLLQRPEPRHHLLQGLAFGGGRRAAARRRLGRW